MDKFFACLMAMFCLVSSASAQQVAYLAIPAHNRRATVEALLALRVPAGLVNQAAQTQAKVVPAQMVGHPEVVAALGRSWRTERLLPVAAPDRRGTIIFSTS